MEEGTLKVGAIMFNAGGGTCQLMVMGTSNPNLLFSGEKKFVLGLAGIKEAGPPFGLDVLHSSSNLRFYWCEERLTQKDGWSFLRRLGGRTVHCPIHHLRRLLAIFEGTNNHQQEMAKMECAYSRWCSLNSKIFHIILKVISNITI